MTIWINLFLELLKLLPSLIELKSQKTRIRDQLHDIYEVLLYMLNNTAADRILILYVTNGGKIINKSKNVYSTAEFEVNTPNLEPVRKYWQGQKVDEHYRIIIEQLIKNRSQTILTKHLEQSDLFTAYDAQGVEKSLWFAISDKPKRSFWYCTISYTNEAVLGSKENDAIRFGVGELEKLFMNKK